MNTNNIESNFQLLGTRILQLNIDNDFIGINNDSTELTREYDVTYDLGDSFQLSDGSSDLAALLEMDITVNITCGEKKLELFLLIEGCFMQDMSVDSTQQKTMMEVNGCATLYSIARSVIISVTSQICGNGTIILPMINIFHLRDEIDKEKSE